MKLLIAIIGLLLLLQSCANPKIEIVERQKIVTDSLKYYADEIKYIQDTIRMAYALQYPIRKGETIDDQIKRDHAKADGEMKALSWFLSDEAHYLTSKKNSFQYAYDSLEVELKKY